MQDLKITTNQKDESKCTRVEMLLNQMTKIVR